MLGLNARLKLRGLRHLIDEQAPQRQLVQGRTYSVQDLTPSVLELRRLIR